MSQTPPPLKVSKGHVGNIQCTHMGGGQMYQRFVIYFVPMRQQETKVGGLPTAVAPALLLAVKSLQIQNGPGASWAKQALPHQPPHLAESTTVRFSVPFCDNELITH